MISAVYMASTDSVAQFLTVIVLFAVVLALAYFTTRFVGTYQQGRLTVRNFEPIETYRIANGKYLQLIKAGSKYIVIGIAKDSVTMMCELSEEEIKLGGDDKVSSPVGFKDIMEKARDKFSKGDDKHEE